MAKTLEQDFSYPLADPPAGITDEGERETVRLAKALVMQCVSTFSPEKVVKVSASGHMGYDDWETKAGPVQTVNISISQGSV